MKGNNSDARELSKPWKADVFLTLFQTTKRLCQMVLAQYQRLPFGIK